MKDDYEKSHWPTQKWFVAPVIHRKTVQGSWHVIGKGFLDKAKLQRPYGITWHLFRHTCTAMRVRTLYAQYGHTLGTPFRASTVTTRAARDGADDPGPGVTERTKLRI